MPMTGGKQSSAIGVTLVPSTSTNSTARTWAQRRSAMAWSRSVVACAQAGHELGHGSTGPGGSLSLEIVEVEVRHANLPTGIYPPVSELRPSQGKARGAVGPRGGPPCRQPMSGANISSAGSKRVFVTFPKI